MCGVLITRYLIKKKKLRIFITKVSWQIRTLGCLFVYLFVCFYQFLVNSVFGNKHKQLCPSSPVHRKTPIILFFAFIKTKNVPPPEQKKQTIINKKHKQQTQTTIKTKKTTNKQQT